MKKLLIALFVLGLSLQVTAKIKVKDVVGNWSYTAQTDNGTISGKMNFTKGENDTLTGKVITGEGQTIPLSKIEIKDGDILYYELQPDYDILKVTMKIDGKNFEGTVSFPEGELKVSGSKIE